MNMVPQVDIMMMMVRRRMIMTMVLTIDKNDSHLRSHIGTARPHKSLPGDVVVGQLTVVPYHDLSKEDIFKGGRSFNLNVFIHLYPVTISLRQEAGDCSRLRRSSRRSLPFKNTSILFLKKHKERWISKL